MLSECRNTNNSSLIIVLSLVVTSSPDPLGPGRGAGFIKIYTATEVALETLSELTVIHLRL